MRITLSVSGRFWFFDLARQLFKRGHLNLLLTSYPKFAAARWGIPRKKVRSLLIKEALERGWHRLPTSRLAWQPDFLMHEAFDRWSALHAGGPDIFDGLSGFSLRAIRAAKKKGAVTVVSRGSSHMGYQCKILKEEYEKFGVPHSGAHPRIVEKELQEYAEADHIYVPSLFVKRTFLERGIPESKMIHVPFGVDLALFRQLPKEDGVFRVIFAGGMTLRKGVHYLLQAFTELNLPNSELMLIGTAGEEIKPFFKKYEGRFRHVGHIPQPELHRYYSQGSVFALASIEEGLAMVQPQAMACGLPVIATTNTGGEDIIRDGLDGFIIPIRDVEALKEKILYFYEHPEERARMGASAKARVSQDFTWEDYGDKMVREYERILAK